jgi:hypothetical protein
MACLDLDCDPGESSSLVMIRRLLAEAVNSVLLYKRK